MNIIICEPNVPPYMKSISSKYKDLQTILGTNIKALSLNHPSILIMCNQEVYENKKFESSYRLGIPGTFLFVGYQNHHLRSLTDEEMNEVIQTIRLEDFTLV